LYHGDDRAGSAARRAVWLYDRASRLTALVERAEDQGERLARERCDVPRDDYPARRVIDHRLHLLRERLLKLRVRARNARRAARVFDALAADPTASPPATYPDSVVRSMISPALAERIASGRDVAAMN
jgi:hypothetical protein